MSDSEIDLKLNPSDKQQLINDLREIAQEAQRSRDAVQSVGASLGVVSPGGGSAAGPSGLPGGAGASKAGGNVNASAQPVPPMNMGQGAGGGGYGGSGYGGGYGGAMGGGGNYGAAANVIMQPAMGVGGAGAMAQAVAVANAGGFIPSPSAQGGFNSWWGGFSGRQQARFGREIAGLVGDVINLSNINDVKTDTMTSSRYSAYAGIASSAIGIGVTAATGNPMIGGMVAGAVNSITQPIAQWLGRSQDWTDSGVRNLSQIFGSYYGGSGLSQANLIAGGAGMSYHVPTNLMDNGRSAIPGILASVGVWANRTGHLPDNMSFATPADTGVASPVLSAGAASIASSLFNAGIDPMGTGAFGSLSIGRTDPFGGQRGIFERGARSGRLIDTLIGAAGTAIINASMQNNPPLNNYLTLTARAGRLFGNEFGEAWKAIAPAFSPALGGNVADILTSMGPERTTDYLRLQNNDLTSSVDPMTLARSSAAYATGGRTAGIGALQIRGSGFAAAAGYAGEMWALFGLPGGISSQTYAQARRSLADSVSTGFNQFNTTQFEIPRTRVEGEMARAQVLPYMPSRMFEIAGREIGLNNREIGAARAQMERMRSAGLLDENTELEMTRRIEGLRTSNAQQLAMLSEGRENLLPGLVAGRRRGAGQVDSEQLAALSFARAGVPFRGHGAINGTQLAMQNAYADLIGLGEGDVGPRSRTMNINDRGAMSGGVGDGRAVDLLAAILRQLQNGGALQGTRPGTSAGTVAGQIDDRNVGAGNSNTGR